MHAANVLGDKVGVIDASTGAELILSIGETTTGSGLAVDVITARSELAVDETSDKVDRTDISDDVVVDDC